MVSYKLYRFEGESYPMVAYVDVTELDMKHLIRLVEKDLKYLKSRSATRSGHGADANSAKVTNRQGLLNRLKAIQEER